ncbi:hypothetical protein [Halobacillus halophilus]|nr:hypothetical protein [Halobacillus halophilus]
MPYFERKNKDDANNKNNSTGAAKSLIIFKLSHEEVNCSRESSEFSFRI